MNKSPDPKKNTAINNKIAIIGFWILTIKIAQVNERIINSVYNIQWKEDSNFRQLEHETSILPTELLHFLFDQEKRELNP